jgi:TonB family protein
MQRTRASAPLSSELNWRSPLMPGVRPMTRDRGIFGFVGLAYLPMVLICARDPHPIPGKPVHIPHPPRGTTPLYAPAPKYPLEARKHHWEGGGLVELRLGPDHTVRTVKVLRSTGHSVLDEDAAQALRLWKFTRDSADQIRVPITYSLHCVD